MPKLQHESNLQTGGASRWPLKGSYTRRIKKTHKTSFLPSGKRTAALLYNNDTAMLFPPTSGNRHTGLLSDRVEYIHKTSPKCNKNGLSHLVRIHRLRTSYARPLLKVTLDLGQNFVLFVVSFPVMTVKIVLCPNIYNFWIIFHAVTFIFPWLSMPNSCLTYFCQYKLRLQ